MACRVLSPTDPEVREIKTDDEEFEEVVSSRDLPTTMPTLTKDGEGKQSPTESPNTKDGEKRRRPQPDYKKNNSKDKNSGKELLIIKYNKMKKIELKMQSLVRHVN